MAENLANVSSALNLLLPMSSTYFPFVVGLVNALGIGLTGVESPRQLTHSHFPVGRDLNPTQKVWYPLSHWSQNNILSWKTYKCHTKKAHVSVSKCMHLYIYVGTYMCHTKEHCFYNRMHDSCCFTLTFSSLIWTLPSLKLEASIIANRDFNQKAQTEWHKV